MLGSDVMAFKTDDVGWSRFRDLMLSRGYDDSFINRVGVRGRLRYLFYVDYFSGLDLENYQVEELLSSVPLRIVEKSRQIGLSYVYSLRMLIDCLLFSENWFIVSISKDEASSKISYVLEIIDLYCSKLRSDLVKSSSSYHIQFTNGGSIFALSYTQLRGKSGNILIDEAAWIRSSDFSAIIKMVLPIISRDDNDYVIRFISSSSYPGHPFYSLMRLRSRYSLRGRIVFKRLEWWYSRAFCNDVDLAIKECPLLSTGERVRRFGKRGIRLQYSFYQDDLVTFRREFECIVENNPDVVFDYDSLLGVMDEGIGKVLNGINAGLYLSNLRGQFWLGIDIGQRRNTTELALYDIENRCISVILTLDRVGLTIQESFLDNLLSSNPDIVKISIDSSGIGAHIGEYLLKKYGNIRVECIEFTNKLKQQLVNNVMKLVLGNEIKLPMNKLLIEHFMDLRSNVSHAGRTIYDSASRSHNNDMFWAIALSLKHLIVENPSPAFRFSEMNPFDMVDRRQLNRLNNRLYKALSS